MTLCSQNVLMCRRADLTLNQAILAIGYFRSSATSCNGRCGLREGRKFIGGELKESYWRNAIRNLENAVAERNQTTLFDMAAS